MNYSPFYKFKILFSSVLFSGQQKQWKSKIKKKELKTFSMVLDSKAFLLLPSHSRLFKRNNHHSNVETVEGIKIPHDWVILKIIKYKNTSYADEICEETTVVSLLLHHHSLLLRLSTSTSLLAIKWLNIN